MKKIFIFDFDGTITSEETLPLIAKHFRVESEINELTKETIKGNIPFLESFIRRVNILGKLNIHEIDNLIYNVKLHNKVFNFIQKNRNICAIATGNLDCWTRKINERIGCKFYSSNALISDDNTILKLTTILKKENIVKEYKDNNYKVIFIGDGNNDMEAMRLSDISIASGLTHEPARSILDIADYLIYNEEGLCRLLNQLL